MLNLLPFSFSFLIFLQTETILIRGMRKNTIYPQGFVLFLLTYLLCSKCMLNLLPFSFSFLIFLQTETILIRWMRKNTIFLQAENFCSLLYGWVNLMTWSINLMVCLVISSFYRVQVSLIMTWVANLFFFFNPNIFVRIKVIFIKWGVTWF